jgi:hypothetical protein
LLGLLVAGSTATAQQLGTVRFDNWLSFQRNADQSGQWLYQPRFYIPFELSRGWTFTQRIDLPLSYTDEVGTDNPGGGWKGGIGDWFIEEILTSPELAPNFRMWASVRLVFPTGGASPFGAGQYQWAPALSVDYAMPEHGITFSPVARYFMSYHATEPGAGRIRRLDLYPIVTFVLPDSWSLVTYPENGISYNAETHKWFVPLDLMLIKRLTKSTEFGFGAAYTLVKDDPLYRYIVYGRLTFYF